MPVVIGAPRERGFDQPLGVLSDCHRRVEKFLAILEAIAATDPTRELDPGERASLCLALDYFRDSAPKHTADEEESLFPRLRVAGGGSALERLERDHREAAPRHQEVERIGRVWLESSAIPASKRTQFAAAVRSLSELYRQHIAVEEDEVFPLAQRVLTPSEQLEVGREMAARRGIRVPEAHHGSCE